MAALFTHTKMAALFTQRKMAALSRSFRSLALIKPIRLQAPISRLKSDAHVVMTDDSSTIVCWHPEKDFPYEKSLPLPEKRQVMKSDSVLKVQSSKEFLEILKPKRQEVIREELMRLTFTTKHVWFPRKFQFRRKPRIEPDRPYL